MEREQACRERACGKCVNRDNLSHEHTTNHTSTSLPKALQHKCNPNTCQTFHLIEAAQPYI
jgi:hypothetical protein